MCGTSFHPFFLFYVFRKLIYPFTPHVMYLLFRHQQALCFWWRMASYYVPCLYLWTMWFFNLVILITLLHNFIQIHYRVNYSGLSKLWEIFIQLCYLLSVRFYVRQQYVVITCILTYVSFLCVELNFVLGVGVRGMLFYGLRHVSWCVTVVIWS